MAGGNSLYHRAYRALEPTARSGGLSLINKILVGLIVIASAFAIIETEPTLSGSHPKLFRNAELLFGIVFSIEYFARIWIAPLNPTWAKYRFPRLRYMFSLAAIIDLLAILPTLLALGPGGGSVLLRFFRVLRILRLAKLGRMSRAFQDLNKAVSERKEAKRRKTKIKTMAARQCSIRLWAILLNGTATVRSCAWVTRIAWQRKSSPLDLFPWISL